MTEAPLEILYADNHLLAVNKPAGLPCQPDASGDPTLVEAVQTYLKEKYQKPGNVFVGLVHRLDRPVAGVVVLARTSKAAARLSAAFREGRIEKVYRAVVVGCLENEGGRLAHWLRKVSRRRRSEVTGPNAPGARRALLDYRVLETMEGTSLLEVALLTGRSHQIRVQLAAVGHPILGDLKYGAGAPLSGGAIALYARCLRFDHPTRDQVVEIVAPDPRGWPWPPGKPARGQDDFSSALRFETGEDGALQPKKRSDG
ncbi:MAG: RNA pseudouridine synthase [Desulfobacterales bacterium]|jgi:23S rRNA pseudouridine1911/1915/1917 synthase|nr:RNA pseudouridine synthase [Desulfobacterales bacterium]